MSKTALSFLLVVGGIAWLVASLGGRPALPRDTLPTSETPLDILKRRYATGEIAKEQYEQMKQDLGV